MNSLHQLSTQEIRAIYKKALDLGLEKDFIALLSAELKDREQTNNKIKSFPIEKSM